MQDSLQDSIQNSMQGARRIASNSTLRSMVCFALVAALHTTVHADAPGMLLYSGTSIGQRAFEAPFRKFVKIGEHGVGAVNGSTFPLTAILPGGEPFIFVDDPKSPYVSPPSDLRPLSDIGMTAGAVIAVQDDGFVRSWGPLVYPWLPSEPVVDLSIRTTGVGCVGQSGQVHVWNRFGVLPHSGTSGDAIRLAIGHKWGLALRANGTLESFTFLDGTTPVFAFPEGVVDIAAGGNTVVPLALAIRTDGSLKSLTTPFSAPGDFRKVCLNSSRMITLDAVGRAQSSTWNSSTSDWNPLAEIPGRYDDVGTPAAGPSTIPMFAICSTDSDRNGEEDRVQILRGDMPDANGDLVNDAVQPPTTLLDEDANGVPDVCESATISGRKKASDVLWTAGGARYAVGWFSLDRVPPAAGTLRSIRVQHPLLSPSPSSVAGREIAYGIWVDPNGDGSPVDAVRVFEAVLVLDASGVQSIDLDGLWVGPPGTCIFHGFRYSQLSGESQIMMFPADTTDVPTGGDPFAVSRRRGRCWLNSTSHPIPLLTTTQLLRTAYSLDGMGGYYSPLSNLCLTWDDRVPTDADNDGMLDPLTCGAATPSWWIREPDLDTDGVPDGTSPDCDGDGALDIVAIRNGASDCDRNLVADDCSAVEYRMPSQPPPAVSGNEAVRRWTFRALPRPIGGGTLMIEASAALADPASGLSIRIDGGTPIQVFLKDGDDCASPANTHAIQLDEQHLAALLADEVLAVEVASIGNPSSISCPGAFVRIGLQYTIRAAECVVNGIPDRCETEFPDCNGNGLDDGCELDNPANDVDGNGTLDGCELDCDRNGTPDAHELALDPSLDCDGSGYLDVCEFVDCDNNGLHDPCQITAPADDCNADGLPDVCQSLPDSDADGTPDTCECPADIDNNGEVSGADLTFLLLDWGAFGNLATDIDRDGDVDAQDLSILLEAWGVCGS